MIRRVVILAVWMLMLSFGAARSFGELLAYYPMTDITGTEIADASNYEHTAIAGAEPVIVDGPDGFGHALFFDGSNPAPGWVNCGTWNPSEQTGQMSCTFWVNWSGPNGNWQGVVAKRTGYDPEPDGAMMWYFEISQTDGNIFFGRRGQYAAGGYVLPIGEWKNVAIACDGATGTMYIDAEVIGSGNFTFGPTTDSPILIGCDENNGYNGFNGAIDEVRIYDTALTQEEIQTVMFDTGAPVELAFAAKPSDKAVEVLRDAVLSWRAGRYADKHDVYFGTNVDDVNEAGRDNPLGVLVSHGQEETTYNPDGLLDYNQTYYWRIDEVNDVETGSPWKGFIWSFTTVDFIVVEDFEEYSDFPPNEVWNTWIDGYNNPLNGSTAGYPDPDFVVGEHYVETENVHSGSQALPLFYDNAAGISEVTRSSTGTITDWTTDDVIALTLFYYGDAANAAEPMYVAVNDSAVVTNDDAGAVLVTEWTRWDIPLQEFTDQGVNLSNVNSLTIGFGNKANPTAGGGSGMVLIDDIRLYRTIPDQTEPEPEEPVEPVEPVDPGNEGLVAYYSLDGDVSDGSGNGNDGTIVGNPEFVADGAVGNALDFNGDDYVDCGNSPLFDVSDAVTVAAWVNIRSLPQAWSAVVAKGNSAWRVSNNNLSTGMHFAFEDGSRGWQAANSATQLPLGEWHHVCGVYDTNVGAKIYIDGVEDGSNTDTAGITHSDYNVYIGENSESLNNKWDGGIDEVYIFNRALSAGEVLYLANQ